MYKPLNGNTPPNWIDQLETDSDKYTITSQGGYSYLKSAKTVIRPGTPQSATNFNNIESGVVEAYILAKQALLGLRVLLTDVRESVPIYKMVSLANSQTYPFNNSKATIAFKANELKNTLNYIVEAQVVSATGGSVGRINVSDMLTNGFKVEYTGGATAVTLRLAIRGGFTA
ncbi:hypothetical protein FACS18949_13480 [Clostridia bacterium]|nr:hypothetical protein FACS189425_08830 [Clostridia bacterium]GHV35459.1 hypothetical protein FACS18949_13480 [Clostridia bacterium]